MASSSSKLILDSIQRLADGDDKEACYQLAQCFAEGKEGAAQNNYLALFYFKKAAESGHFEAQMEIARNYGRGRLGVDQNLFIALKEFEKAYRIATESAQRAKSLYSISCCYIGLNKQKGSYEKGISFLEESAKLGYPKAQLLLGWCSVPRTINQKIEFNQGIDWIHKASAQKYSPAYAALSICYNNGWGVSQDQITAASWLLRESVESNDFREVNEILRIGENYHPVRELEIILTENLNNEVLFKKLAEQPLSDTEIKRLLILAVTNGYLNFLKYLIEKRSAVIHVRNENDETLLMLAVRHQWVQIVYFLLQVNSDNPDPADWLLAKNRDGHTALDIHYKLAYSSPHYSSTRAECIRLIGLVLGKQLDNTTSKTLSALSVPSTLITPDERKELSLKNYQMASLKRIAKQGCALTQYELGVLYLQDDNMREAAIWLEKSAERGNVAAQNHLDTKLYPIKPTVFARQDLIYIAAVYCRNIIACMIRESSTPSISSSSSLSSLSTKSRMQALDYLLVRIYKEGLNFILEEEHFKELNATEEQADLYLQHAISAECYYLVALLLRVFPAEKTISEKTLSMLENKNKLDNEDEELDCYCCEADFCLSIYHEEFTQDEDKVKEYLESAGDFLEAMKYAVIKGFENGEEEWLKEAANEGDLLSCTLLGKYYEKIKRSSEAMQCYQEAAYRGERSAQLILCQKYKESNGIQGTIFWGLKAASQGSNEALALLSQLLWSQGHRIENLREIFSYNILLLHISHADIIYMLQLALKQGCFSLAARFNDYLINHSSSLEKTSVPLMIALDQLIPENKEITLTKMGDQVVELDSDSSAKKFMSSLKLDVMTAAQRPSDNEAPYVSKMVWEWGIVNRNVQGGFIRYYLDENIKLAESHYRQIRFSSIFHFAHKTLSSRFFMPSSITKLITSYAVHEPSSEEISSDSKLRISF